jgi:hypothetical protein
MAMVCLMLLLVDDIITQIIIRSIKDAPFIRFLIIRHKICCTFRRIYNSDEVLLHVLLCDLRQVCKNRYVRLCFERCFCKANYPEVVCFEGMKRLMWRRNPDKGLKLFGDAAAEDSGVMYF